MKNEIFSSNGRNFVVLGITSERLITFESLHFPSLDSARSLNLRYVNRAIDSEDNLRAIRRRSWSSVVTAAGYSDLASDDPPNPGR